MIAPAIPAPLLPRLTHHAGFGSPIMPSVHRREIENLNLTPQFAMLTSRCWTRGTG